MIIETQSLENFYEEAKESLQKCLDDRDNAFLQDEIDMPLKDIIFVNEKISIHFMDNIIYQYIIEIKIKLRSHKDISIGTYYYYRNQDGHPLDDKLVFT